MNVEATKLELMQLLLEAQKEDVLNQIKEVFEREKSLEVMVRKDMLESAERANSNIKAGLGYTPAEIEELLEKRFGK